MNLRDIYFKMRPPGVGRDRFESMGKQLGLQVKRRRNRWRTTDSSGVKRFSNYLKGLAIVRINQVWQSDITYYQLSGRFYYLTFIQDTYTKLIVGHSVSRSLQTETSTLPALKMALSKKRSAAIKELILHSDGGGQYYSDDFLALTASKGITNSMCKEAYDNGMAERLNGIIKNNYLKYYDIRNYEQLVRQVDRAVTLYNTGKPHSSLGRRTPIERENELRGGQST